MLSFIRKPKKISFLLIDALLIIAAFYLAFLLRFEGKILPPQFLNIIGASTLALMISLPAFYFFRLYSFSLEYASTNELINLAKATTLSFLFLGASLFIFRDETIFQGFPRSTLIISYFLVFLFCGAVRFSKRLFLQLLQGGSTEEKKRTLIVGAGDAGEQIARTILTFKNTPYLPIGFVDDDPSKQGETIHGIKVLGRIDDIPKLVDKHRAEEMIIAIPSANSKFIKGAVEKGREAGLQKIKITPSIAEIIDGQISLGNIREIQVEDLLGRETVSLDTEAMEDFIKDKIILVTGAAGSIGSELCRQIAKFNPSLLLLLDQDETGIFNISGELAQKFPKLKFSSIISDIQDKDKIDRVFNRFGPNVVFHAAAYKHVPLMEAHSDEAVKNNVFGTIIVTESALKYNVDKFIFISTDKAVNPVSIMGATKRVGEFICQSFNKKNKTSFISVRFGNVLDSRGSVIPIFKGQIKRGGPVEITHPEMKRYFMTTPEACLLVIQASLMGQGGEVFVLDMGDPIKILDLAKETIRLAGFEPDRDIPIVFTSPRPGEKLFEDILTAEEGVIATQNQKIFMAKLIDFDEKKLNQGLKKLKDVTKKLDEEKIRAILKEIIQS